MTRHAPAGNLTKRSDPIGTSAIVLTNDGYIPLGRRALSLDVNPGRIFTFGGFFDSLLDRGASLRPDLFACFRREFEEETGLSLGSSNMDLLGIVYDNVHPHPEAVAMIQPATIGAKDILDCRWQEELESLEVVHLTSLKAFVREHRLDITEGLLGGLEQLLSSERFEALLKAYAK
jgi:8-oxo-dGTP pyrophosphatase MutT (NUDIX family)